MFVYSDVQSVSTIHLICLGTNKQQFYVHKMQYETHLKVTLWFNMAPSSSPCCDAVADVSSGGRCDAAQLTRQTGLKALWLSGLMPKSRWYSTENGAPDLHQSPAPSRLSWFLCTGRWRSRPHWTVSLPLRRSLPDCRRCPIASLSPPWRAGSAEAPFPPHLQKRKRCDSEFRGARGWCENRSRNVLVHTGEGRAGWRCEWSCNSKSIKNKDDLFLNHIQLFAGICGRYK